MNDLQFIKSAENTLLASYMFDYKLLEETSFKEDYFYFGDSKSIFKAMKNVLKKGLPLDESFILKELNSETYNNRLIEIITVLPETTPLHLENLLINEFGKRELKRILTQKINDLDNEDIKVNQVISDVSNLKLGNVVGTFPIKNTSTISPEKPEFYISEICPIQRKEINLFTAKSGAGKSFSLLYLLAQLQKTGLNCFGWFSEDSDGGTKNRLMTLQNIHNDIKNTDIDILGKEFRLESFIKISKNGNFEISDFFFEFTKAMKPYEIILLDPLVSLICKDENNNIEIRYLMNLLNAWIEKENKTLIIIHHDGKNEAVSSRGASDIVGAVRMHYSIENIENMNTHRKFVLKKCNHYFGNKKEFIVQLFKNEIKPVEVVFENKDTLEIKDNNDFDMDMSVMDILNDTDTLKKLNIEIEKKEIQKKPKEYENLKKGGYFG